jgi:hypothetical protein
MWRRKASHFMLAKEQEKRALSYKKATQALYTHESINGLMH